MTKKEKLTKYVVKTLKEYKFEHEMDINNNLVVNTKAGILYIKRVESDRRLSSIFMHFENPTLALDYAIDCNPYTGKWNIHELKLEDAMLRFTEYMNMIKF